LIHRDDSSHTRHNYVAISSAGDRSLLSKLFSYSTFSKKDHQNLKQLAEDFFSSVGEPEICSKSRRDGNRGYNVIST